MKDLRIAICIFGGCNITDKRDLREALRATQHHRQHQAEEKT